MGSTVIKRAPQHFWKPWGSPIPLGTTIILNSNMYPQPGECFHCWLRIHHAASICHQCAAKHGETALLVTEWENIAQTATVKAQKLRLDKGRKYLDKAADVKRVLHDHQRAWRVQKDLKDVTKLLQLARQLHQNGK